MPLGATDLSKVGVVGATPTISTIQSSEQRSPVTSILGVWCPRILTDSIGGEQPQDTGIELKTCTKETIMAEKKQKKEYVLYRKGDNGSWEKAETLKAISRRVAVRPLKDQTDWKVRAAA